MKILIYGAGAIGSVFGGFLAKSGEEVVMLGRPQQMETIKSKGLKIEGIWGDHLINSNILCYSNGPDLKEDHGTSFDLIIITVKAYDTLSASSDIRNMVNMDTLVLSLQNGIGNTDMIAKGIGADQVLGGMVIFGAEIFSPGSVRVTVSADDVVIGRISDKTEAKRVEEIANIFTAAGIKTRTTEEINKAIWNKVIYNCSLNALASTLGITYGQLLESEHTKDIMRRIIAEIYALAQKCAIDLEPKTKEEYIKILFNHLIPLTATHKPSMLQDIEKRRRTEIDYLNGMVVQMSKDHGLSSPVNQVLTELIKFKEKKRSI